MDQVPCGIFDDPKLVADVNEAVATIKKARLCKWCQDCFRTRPTHVDLRRDVYGSCSGHALSCHRGHGADRGALSLDDASEHQPDDTLD